LHIETFSLACFKIKGKPQLKIALCYASYGWYSNNGAWA